MFFINFIQIVKENFLYQISFFIWNIFLSLYISSNDFLYVFFNLFICRSIVCDKRSRRTFSSRTTSKKGSSSQLWRRKSWDRKDWTHLLHPKSCPFIRACVARRPRPRWVGYAKRCDCSGSSFSLHSRCSTIFQHLLATSYSSTSQFSTLTRYPLSCSLVCWGVILTFCEIFFPLSCSLLFCVSFVSMHSATPILHHDKNIFLIEAFLYKK